MSVSNMLEVFALPGKMWMLLFSGNPISMFIAPEKVFGINMECWFNNNTKIKLETNGTLTPLFSALDKKIKEKCRTE